MVILVFGFEAKVNLKATFKRTQNAVFFEEWTPPIALTINLMSTVAFLDCNVIYSAFFTP